MSISENACQRYLAEIKKKMPAENKGLVLWIEKFNDDSEQAAKECGEETLKAYEEGIIG